MFSGEGIRLRRGRPPSIFIKGNDVVVGFLDVKTVNHREDSGEEGREDCDEESHHCIRAHFGK